MDFSWRCQTFGGGKALLDGWPGHILFVLDIAGQGRQYHFDRFRGSIGRRRVPHPRFVRVGLGVILGALHAGRIKAVLRTWRSAFCYVQLLSQVTVAGKQEGALSFCERTCPGAAGVWIPAGWLRGDAKSCAFADE